MCESFKKHLPNTYIHVANYEMVMCYMENKLYKHASIEQNVQIIDTLCELIYEIGCYYLAFKMDNAVIAANNAQESVTKFKEYIQILTMDIAKTAECDMEIQTVQ